MGWWVGCPIKLSDSPAEVGRPPILGEHTDAPLGSLRDVSPEGFQDLRQSGVI